MIESPVRDSKSNGSVERAVRTWAAQVRTLRHHLESRLRMKVPRTSALMTWLVAWSADVINRYKIRSSGRTSYEHITGHRGLQAITAFGEKVMFKYTTDKTKWNKMETEWGTGYFIGINSRTTVYFIAEGSGIFWTTSIRRHQDDKAYDPEIVKDVTILHGDYTMHGDKSTPTHCSDYIMQGDRALQQHQHQTQQQYRRCRGG